MQPPPVFWQPNGKAMEDCAKPHCAQPGGCNPQKPKLCRRWARPRKCRSSNPPSTEQRCRSCQKTRMDCSETRLQSLSSEVPGCNRCTTRGPRRSRRPINMRSACRLAPRIPIQLRLVTDRIDRFRQVVLDRACGSTVERRLAHPTK